VTATMACRIANLEQAKRVKVVRAAIKQGLREVESAEQAREAIARLLEDPPVEFVGTMAALDLVTAGRYLGRGRGRRYLLVAGIPERRRIMDFTDRQRTALIAALREGPV